MRSVQRNLDYVRLSGFNPIGEETWKFLSNLPMNCFIAMVMRIHLDKKKDVTEQNYIKCKCFEKVLALQEHYYIKGIERHLSHFLRKLHLAPFQFRMAFLLS